MEKNNTTFLDLLSKYRTGIMGIAMISIILFHQKFITTGCVYEFFYKTGHWGVDVFLFVSGMGLTYSLNKNSIKQFYINRAKRLIIPCAICGVLRIGLVVCGWDALIVANDTWILLLTCLNLWFIYALCYYYPLAPLIYKLIKKYGIIVFIIISAVCFFNKIPFAEYKYAIRTLSFVVGRLPVFVFGMYVTIKGIDFRNKYLLLCSMLSFAFALWVAYTEFWKHSSFEYGWMYIFIMFGVPFMCYCYIAVIKLFAMLKINKLIHVIGVYSLEIYLWHEFVFANMMKFSPISNQILNLIVSLIIVVTASWITHVSAAKLLSVIKVDKLLTR